MTTAAEALETALRGRVALVTGASRGIGAAIARALARAGATVAVNYRGVIEAAASVVREIEEEGGARRAPSPRT